MLLAEAAGSGVVLVETREPLLALGLGIVTSLRHREPSCRDPMPRPDQAQWVARTVTIMAPKSVFGYRWNPFGTDIMDPDANHDRVLKMSIIYAPLIFLDHKIWHTKKEMSQVGSGDYRVKNFFDWNTMTYRDIEPD